MLKRFGARRSIAFVLSAIATATIAPPGAGADAPSDTSSVFFISKSENKNQVHYGVRLDTSCRPLTAHPVFAYWKMLEKGGTVEPLLDREQPAYGINDAQTVVDVGEVTRIVLRLRAFRDRPVSVLVRRLDTGCEAVAQTNIAGEEARLENIYIKLAWPLGVDYALVTGTRLRDGRWIKEKVVP